MENEEQEVVETQETSTEDETSENTEQSSVLSAEEIEKLRAENGSLKRELKKVQKTVKDVDSTVEQRIEKIELRAEGYTDEQIDEILSLGGKKVLENPTIKRAFEDAKKQSQVEKAVDIDSSGGSYSRSGYTQEEISKMSSDEYAEKILKKK